MNQKLSVRLRHWRGSKMEYNEKGEPSSESNTIAMDYDTQEWYRFLSNLRINGYLKVVVVEIRDRNKKVSIKDPNSAQEFTSYELIEDADLVANVNKEIHAAMNPQVTTELTPEQKQLSEQKAQLEIQAEQIKLLMSLVPTQSPEELKELLEPVITDPDAELIALREEYTNTTAEMPKMNWKAPRLRIEINNFKNVNK